MIKSRKEKSQTSSLQILFYGGACYGLFMSLLLFFNDNIQEQTDLQISLSPKTHNVAEMLVPNKGQDVVNQPSTEIRASKKLFSELPHDKQKTFFVVSRKPCPRFGFARSVNYLGWSKVDEVEDARLIFTFDDHNGEPDLLQSWQRSNYIPSLWSWTDEITFFSAFRKAADNKTHFSSQFHFLPETYELNVEKDRMALHTRLEHGGADQVWLQKGDNKMKILNPKSLQLVESDSQRHTSRASGDTIVQQYVANEMTWDDRKFDVRVFFFVASIDPLIVFYMDGCVQIASRPHDEGKLDQNMLIDNKLKMVPSASFADLEERIRRECYSKPGLKFDDPVQHVRNQFKSAIGQIIEVLHKTTTLGGQTTEDGFELFVADFSLDKDLNVWLVDIADSSGVAAMKEDHYFRLDLHHRLYYGIASILQEVWAKQSAGEPIFPLQDTGDWQAVYADGWRFQYTPGSKGVRTRQKM